MGKGKSGKVKAYLYKGLHSLTATNAVNHKTTEIAMKNFPLFAMTLAAGFALSNAALTISANGTMYTPMVDTIKSTDTVTFTLNTNHNAQEVSQST